MNTSVDLSWTGVWVEDILGFHFFISLHPAGTAPHTPPSGWSHQGEVWTSGFHSADKRPKSSQSEKKHTHIHGKKTHYQTLQYFSVIVRSSNIARAHMVMVLLWSHSVHSGKCISFHSAFTCTHKLFSEKNYNHAIQISINVCISPKAHCVGGVRWMGEVGWSWEESLHLVGVGAALCSVGSSIPVWAEPVGAVEGQSPLWGSGGFEHDSCCWVTARLSSGLHGFTHHQPARKKKPLTLYPKMHFDLYLNWNSFPPMLTETACIAFTIKWYHT